MVNEITLFLEQVAVEFQGLMPRLLASILIVVVGYVVGLLAQRLSRRTITYLNRIINEQIQGKSLKVDLKVSAVFISKTFFWIILIISLLISLKTLRLDFSNTWFEGLILYVPNVIAAVIIVFIGVVLGRLMGDLVASSTTRTGLGSGQSIGRIVRYLILFIAIFVAIDQLGVQVGFLTDLVIIVVAALLFGASLAFGLGAKTSVSNVLGSYYARKSYQLGNTIQIGEVSGVIVKIMDHAITIENQSGLVVIPAREFAESQVTIVNH